MDELQEIQVCCLCGQAGDGWWSLCPACRQRLAERQADHLAAMLVSECIGCLRPLRSPRRGQPYCPGCQRKYRMVNATATADQDARPPVAQRAEPVASDSRWGSAGRGQTSTRPRETQQRGKGGVDLRRNRPERRDSGQEYI